MGNNWTHDNIPSQKGKSIVITGANSGIGFEAAKVLAQKGAHVTLACRNASKGTAAKDRICQTTDTPDTRIVLELVDMASLLSVKQFCHRLCEKQRPIDILINNAGVMVPPLTRTEDGFELQMGVNHLAHFALTGQLLPLLKMAGTSRIVNIASQAHRIGDTDFSDIHWQHTPYKKMKAYGQSKLANLLFTFSLQQKLAASGSRIGVTAAHPGWTHTDLMRHSSPMNFLARYVAMNVSKGALSTLRAATEPSARPGSFFGPKGVTQMNGYPVEVRAAPQAYDPEAAQTLWQLSQEATKVSFHID